MVTSGADGGIRNTANVNGCNRCSVGRARTAKEQITVLRTAGVKMATSERVRRMDPHSLLLTKKLGSIEW